ncbi:MAG: flagellar M-ring protein FliF C-terminal domain-containing protein, partial [Thiobacillus sp.]|nr:flagellar M-ring protein FliF C-terminal domain-containing protein [Thiobacillus sp.]
PATAPIVAPGKGTAADATASSNTRKDATVNYEVDKTIQYVQQGGGGLKRLSVAVVVNFKKTTDKAGKVTMTPLSEAETTQITNLVKEAMGYNEERGDTVKVVNTPFATTEQEVIPEVPLWKQPNNIQLAKDSGKYLLMALGLLILYLRLLKPMVKKLTEAPALPAPSAASAMEQQFSANGELMALPNTPSTYQENLSRAQKLATEDPRVVANIVKTWVSSNE